VVVRDLGRARVARGAVEGGHGRVAVQGAGERMLAATRSKDEYSHVTRAYWSGRFGVDGGKAGIRPER
jgi:hypothetical protein